jgi:hypothetical protein
MEALCINIKWFKSHPNVIVNAKVSKDRAAAVYLENVVNEMAQDGWGFNVLTALAYKNNSFGSLFGGSRWSSQLLCDYIPQEV